MSFTRDQVAIVILNWNGRHMLERFLPAVVSFSEKQARIIVADNASSDDSLDFLKKNYPGIELILLDNNYGFTGGYNRALKQVDAAYYILLNSDVEVTANWIKPIIEYMQLHPEVAACQPKLRSCQDRHLLEHAGAAGGYIDYLGYPFCRGRMFTELEEDKGQYDTIQSVFWASGAAMFIRSADYHAMEGFDENFFAHMEEIDLCWRLQQSGKSIAVIPQSTVYHVGGGTLPKSSPRKTYYNFRNNLLMLHKNLPGLKLYFIIPIRLVLDGIAGIKFLLDGDYKDCLSVIKAHFSFYAQIPGRISVRSKQRKARKTSHASGVYTGSIVWSYYLKGIKKFSGLNSAKFQ
jgi:GT2 family glycosyltransferase